MSRRTLWFTLEVLAAIILIASILTAPFFTGLIENPWYRALTWVVVVVLVFAFAVPLGLMPYFGMREKKRDKDTALKDANEHLVGLRPLEILRDNQESQSKRDWLLPILAELEIVRSTDGGTSGKVLFVSLAFASCLVEELAVSRLTGTLFIRQNNHSPMTGPQLRIELFQMPKRILPLSQGDKFSEQIPLTNEAANLISAAENEGEPISVKLTLALEPQQGDVIRFDPNDDDPFHLSRVLYPPHWRSK